MEKTYSILVDGQSYEGSADKETAMYLYRTVDETIGKEYDGHTKSLIQMGNRYDQRTWQKLLEDEIHCPKEELEYEILDGREVNYEEDENENEELHYHFHR